MWILICWKEFSNRKMVDSAEIVNVESLTDAITKMQTFNAEKQLTTSDYRAFNLEDLIENKGLILSESIEESDNTHSADGKENN